MTSLESLLRRFGIGLQDIAGAAVSGEIPLTNAVVNRFIAAQLEARQLPVSAVQLDAQDGDTFAARILPKARIVPPIRIAARIERQPSFPNDPVLWLRWSMPAIGPLAQLAAPALSLFTALPDGIRADGDRIAIDVRTLLSARGLVEVVNYLSELRVHTRAGAFIVRVSARAPGGAERAEG